jgi:adenylate kinase family enzyme
VAKAVGSELGWKVINTGHLLKQEEEKKTETSQKIYNAKKNFNYVDDKIVTELVTNAV